jgi:hypothetical protein
MGRERERERERLTWGQRSDATQRSEIEGSPGRVERYCWSTCFPTLLSPHIPWLSVPG